ncbi:MAG: GMC oxidoreductase [Aquabacterium sp.]|nr:GMC oxidoreductase [Aquabacterium sp.]
MRAGTVKVVAPDAHPFRAQPLFPGSLKHATLRAFIHDAAGTCFHQSGTARMGRDADAVVAGALRVHGLAGLRAADASVMPTLARCNTMAPTVVIAERTAELLRAAHGLAGG